MYIGVQSTIILKSDRSKYPSLHWHFNPEVGVAYTQRTSFLQETDISTNNTCDTKGNGFCEEVSE